MTRRRFNSTEKVALYLAADGQCSKCGTELGAGWHGDHIQPHSKGGKTDVLNGQALCASCNQAKGDSVGWEIPGWFTPFKWQKEATKDVLDQVGSENTHALIAVSPGAGKTLFGLSAACLMKQQRLIEKLIVVVPSVDLKRQWRDEATRFGINLNTRSIYPAADDDGVAITYQALSSTTAAALRKLSSRALVIGDEIHRAGAEAEDVVWGERYEHAFDNSFFNLLMSGTPIRPPGKGKMPFVSYEGDPPTARALYTYSYGDALADECVRELVFPSYDGEVEWFDNSVWDRLTLHLSDKVSEKLASSRYRNALTPAGRLLIGIMKRADERLSHIRRYEHADGGGIILCKDQAHAKKVASVMHRICGEEPALVISDNEESSRDLKDFANSNRRWIVAVNKISEGVNIPRLRVEIYATNVRDSEAGFRQRALRVGRYMPAESLPKNKNRRGYVYLLADGKLLSYAEDIKIERDHALQEKEEREQTNGASDTLQDLLPDLEPANPITSDPEDYLTITSEFAIEPEQTTYAESLRRNNPALTHLAIEDIYAVIRANSTAIVEERGGSASPTDNPMSKEERKELLRRDLARLVGFAGNKHQVAYSHLNSEINERAIRKSRDDFSEADLEEAIVWVKEEYQVW